MHTVPDKKYTLLIINNSPAAIEDLTAMLEDSYLIDSITQVTQNLDLIKVKDALPDLILLDIGLPGMSDVQLCRKIKGDQDLTHIPIIFIKTESDNKAKVDAFNSGAADFVSKPFVGEELRIRINIHLKISELQRELKRQNQELERRLEIKSEEISNMQLSTIYALVKLTDYRDDILGSHLERTQILCKIIAERLSKMPAYKDSIDNTYIDNIYKSSALHDIGKVAIPDGIYLKPDKLTYEEFEIIKTHTTVGYETLQKILAKFPDNEFIRTGIDIAKYHHEKWNGKGYPDGLIGELIPLSARIMAVADVFDALRTKRPYKPAYSHDDSIKIIIEGNGNHFDPAIVEAFMKSEDQARELYSTNQ